MPRKNEWLPGQPGVGSAGPGEEPGGQPDRLDAPRYGGRSLTPLGDLISSGVLLAGAVVIAYWGFVRAQPLNLGAFLVVAVAILVIAGVAAWRTRHAIRRIRWRRRNIALTGGRYLRAWERTPTQH